MEFLRKAIILALLCVPSMAQTVVRIDPGQKYQTFEGWGTSMCWWANRLGGLPKATVDSLVRFVVDTNVGLGLSVFRYNIGGGENPAHTHMGTGKNLPGYKPTQTGPYNWKADQNQQNILKSILTQCPSAIIEGFSNSPPYWMTKSGCASGNTDGSNNLKDTCYAAFVDYLTAVTKFFRDSLKVTFRTLDPVNEPAGTWWSANGTQEGCHFDVDKQAQIIRLTKAGLIAKGLTGTVVSASDESDINQLLSDLNTWDTATLSCISQCNTHSYSGDQRTQLAARAAQLKCRLWQSETGPLGTPTGITGYLTLAQRLLLDLRDLKAVAWCEWQIFDNTASWTLFSIDWNSGVFSPNQQFYYRAVVFRFIRPGSVIISSSDNNSLAALDNARGRLTVVLVNAGSASANYSIDLSRVTLVNNNVRIFRTSPTENCLSLPNMIVQNNTLGLSLPAQSVTTCLFNTQVTVPTNPRAPSAKPVSGPRIAASVRNGRLVVERIPASARTIYVMDLHGKILQTRNCSHGSSVEIPMALFPAGLFVVYVNDNEKLSMVRIMVAK
jgi:O-glycosyl hydrolase